MAAPALAYNAARTRQIHNTPPCRFGLVFIHLSTTLLMLLTSAVPSTGPLITAVGLSGLLVAEYTHTKAAVWLTKPLAAAGFLYTAYHSPAAATSTFGKTILASLGFSFLGDVCLIVDQPAWFQAGLFSFLLGHIGFAVAFFKSGPLDPKLTLTAAAVEAVFGGIVWNWLSPRLPKADRIPVALYTTVISAMGIVAVGSAKNSPAPWDQIIGAIAFQLSDILVARNQFVTRDYWNYLIGLPLYFFAQQTIASLCWA